MKSPNNQGTFYHSWPWLLQHAITTLHYSPRWATLIRHRNKTANSQKAQRYGLILRTTKNSTPEVSEVKMEVKMVPRLKSRLGAKASKKLKWK